VADRCADCGRETVAEPYGTVMNCGRRVSGIRECKPNPSSSDGMALKVVRIPVGNLRSVNRVLAAARRKKLTDVLIIGYDENGELYTGVNQPDGPEVLWLLELAKAKLLHRSVQNIVEKLPST